MKLGYLLGTFPKLSESFIEREIVALRRAGRAPLLFALERGDLAVAREEARAIAAEVRYVPAVLSARVLVAKMRYSLTRPIRTLSASLGYIVGGLADLDHFPGELLRSARAFALARALERAGIEHLHVHFGSFPASCAWIACRLTGIPYSLSVHAWDIYAQGVHLRAKLADARRVVFCHRAALDFARQRYPEVSADHFELIHHGVDPGRFVVPERDGSPPLRVLAVGRLEVKKGFTRLVEAAEILARRGIDFQMDIIGAGPLAEVLARMIDQPGVRDRVRLLGRQPREKVIAAMARADVLAMPCLIARTGDRDGIPNVVLEAMASGLPIAGSEHAGLAEALAHEVHGLLSPMDDPAALAESLERFAREEGLAARLGAAGRRRVEQMFNLDANVQKLIGLFDRIESERGGETRRGQAPRARANRLENGP